MMAPQRDFGTAAIVASPWTPAIQHPSASMSTARTTRVRSTKLQLLQAQKLKVVKAGKPEAGKLKLLLQIGKLKAGKPQAGKLKLILQIAKLKVLKDGKTRSRLKALKIGRRSRPRLGQVSGDHKAV